MNSFNFTILWSLFNLDALFLPFLWQRKRISRKQVLSKKESPEPFVNRSDLKRQFCFFLFLLFDAIFVPVICSNGVKVIAIVSLNEDFLLVLRSTDEFLQKNKQKTYLLAYKGRETFYALKLQKKKKKRRKKMTLYAG